MPTYRYSCLNCNHSEEQSRNISGRDIPGDCKICGLLNSLVRTFTPPTQVQVGGLLRLGGASTRAFRDHKIREAHGHLEAGKKMPAFEKAAILAERDGNPNFKKEHEARIEKASQDLVKWTESNKSLINDKKSDKKIYA